MNSDGVTPLRRLANVIHLTTNLDADAALKIARRMRRLGFAAHRLAETACNRELTRAESARDAQLDGEFKALCAEIGAKAHISGDPRGHVYHVILPGDNAPYNTWGGAERGWGVTER